MGCIHSYPLTLVVVQVGIACLRVGCRAENRVRIFQEILGIFQQLDVFSHQKMVQNCQDWKQSQESCGQKNDHHPHPTPFCVVRCHLVKSTTDITKQVSAGLRASVHFYFQCLFLVMFYGMLLLYIFLWWIFSFLPPHCIRVKLTLLTVHSSLVSTFSTFYLGDRSFTLGDFPSALGSCYTDTHPFLYLGFLLKPVMSMPVVFPKEFCGSDAAGDGSRTDPRAPC